MPSKKKKWSSTFDRRERQQEKSKESDESSKTREEGQAKSLPWTESPQASQPSGGACGSSADQIPDDKTKQDKQDHRGRYGRKHPDGRRNKRQRRHQGRENASVDTEATTESSQTGTQTKTTPQAASSAPQKASGNAVHNRPVQHKTRDDNVDKHSKQVHEESSREHGKGPVMASPFEEGKLPGQTQAKQARTPFPGNRNVCSPSQQKAPTPLRGVLPAKNMLDLEMLKEMRGTDIVQKLSESMARFKHFLRSEEEQHKNDEFIFDLTCILATVCLEPIDENVIKILTALKGSIFFKSKIPFLLDRIQDSETLNYQGYRRRLIQCLIEIFKRFLMPLPSSYADLPYEQLKRALDGARIDRKAELEKELESFKQFRDNIITAERQKRGQRYTNMTGKKPPNDFRDLPICPTNKEMISQERPFLRTNISKGRYDDVEHYLDVQFRLLREDFLEPLREGIYEITHNVPRERRNQSMKCYQEVRIVGKEFTSSGVIYKVKLQESKFSKAILAHSKRLIFGSFVCLSKDNFQTMLFATVANRDPKDVEEGKFDIRFVEDQNVFDIEKRQELYQMAESPAYFEAYYHVLKGLQELNENSLPFPKYLVECSAEVDPPKYLRRDSNQDPVCYDLSKALAVSHPVRLQKIPVLEPEAWPPAEELPLNISQLEALRTGVTTEFSVIQGPPGTGKTYVGAKIARCLLENRKQWDPEKASPMLMVCYTNHALDQFLEKVLEFNRERGAIIRVGGRSKSQSLEGCNLKLFVKDNRRLDKRGFIYWKLKDNLKEIENVQKTVLKAEKAILEFTVLEGDMNPLHVDQLYDSLFPRNATTECQDTSNTFKLWLCNDCRLNDTNQVSDGSIETNHADGVDGSILQEEDKSEGEQSPDHFWAPFDIHVTDKPPQQKVESSYEVKVEETHKGLEDMTAREDEATRIQNQRRLVGEEECMSAIQLPNKGNCEDEDDIDDDENGERWIKVKYKKSSRRQRNEERKDHIGRSSHSTETTSKKRKKKKKGEAKIDLRADTGQIQEKLQNLHVMSDEEAMSVTNIWSLSEENRLRLYLYWAECYRDRHRMEVQGYEQKHRRLCDELEELRAEEEEEVIRKATVVGMTTSGAARYHSMLQKIGPKIVIIEEAAEVMEAHIITSLSRDTNHVILIGDHKQLRPKATVYELAQKYNLEISLFERMVMNSMDCKRLCIQHRMRPEIAALTKRFYDHEILDHETVYKFENVVGISQNMFFVDHCQPESQNGNLQSFSNPHEATFLKYLCKYLLQQGYKPHQITVLTMYIGQLLLLQQQMPRNQFEGIKICAVDNFQGEENDIILLSLVRSNSVGRIGFLSESNRICVALSRARKGFYCIGNLNMLRRQCPVWQGICHDLDTAKAIGDTFELTCQRHKNVTSVRNPGDFPMCGGCRKMCGERLDCGHACDRPCHPSDLYHVEQCRKVCFKSCPNEHQCGKVCHYPRSCPDCSHGMWKTVPKCGHEQSIPCSVDPAAFSCLVKCEKMLPCGHKCRKKCGEVCTAKCKEKCLKSLPCGHNKEMACHRDPTTAECNNDCKKVLECGHPCKKRCKDECQCNEEIMVLLPCKHMKRVLCHKRHDSFECHERCRRTLDCGHECPGNCFEDCRVDLCKVTVIKELPCGHQQSEPCNVDPKKAFCYNPCQKLLDCGHKCPSVCGRQCKEVICEELCQTKCARGHACQKLCHLGRSCDACMVVHNMQLPTCGHTVEKPCYINPKSINCDKPCQRSRACGHPCSSICGKKCEAQPCTLPTNKMLPCGHKVVLPCHKNHLKYKCTEGIEVNLPCGHKMHYECHVAQGAEKKPLCDEKVEKELPCKHKLILPCHKKPDDCKCKKKVDVELSCGHTKSLVCFSLKKDLQNATCVVKTKRKLPCGHETILPCYINPEDHSCQEEVQLTLSCGHEKHTTCSKMKNELTKEECNEMVTMKLPCGHEKQMTCSERQKGNICDAPSDRFLLCEEEVQLVLSCGHKKLSSCSKMRNELVKDECNEKVTMKLPCGHEKKVGCSEGRRGNIFCNAPCDRFLQCGHRCQKKCGENCASYKCAVEVQKDLACGFHKVSCRCSENVSQVVCTNRCQRKLSCGHMCQGKCSEECSQKKCRKKVSKPLNCAGGHSLQMGCSDNPDDFKCKEKCNRKLGCGHLCPGLCSENCENMRCTTRIEDKFPCGHKMENFRCFQRATATCIAPCQRQKSSCKHPCKGVCGKDCSNYPCTEVVIKVLSCGHNIEMLCKHSIDEVQCPAECKAKLSCGHYCTGKCSECQERGSHEFCQHQCRRSLICLHRCKAVCGEPCPPCDKDCPKRCPHGKCRKRCSQLCDSCIEPCTWSCPHYQCNNLCGEECDRPPCDAPCPKKLPCQHPCIGLCGENCPTRCAICNAKKLTSTLAGRGSTKTENKRCLQLLDCGHIISVEEMDAWMVREVGDHVQLLQCPRCSTSITFSFRYGNIVKRTLKNLENVKTQIEQLEVEVNDAAIRLAKDMDATQEYDVKHRKKFGRTDLAFVRSIPWNWNPFNLRHGNRSSVFKFTFKNHLMILQQVRNTEDVLANIKAHREVSEPWKAVIKDAMKNIKEDLENPELDLEILSQIHEKAKKFFLFSQVLQVQVIALTHRIFLSSTGADRQRSAHIRFKKFLQGNDDILDIDWLEKIVNLLRKEVSLASLPKEAQDFENFPGYQRDVWKLCEKGHAFHIRCIVRRGKSIPVGSDGCTLCTVEESDYGDTADSLESDTRYTKKYKWKLLCTLKPYK